MTTTNDRAGRERAGRGARAMSVVVVCAAASLAAANPPLPAAPAGVRTSTEYGIEFVTVGDAGNAGYPRSTVNWTGFGNDRMGRGAVSYEYRIARTEVTTGQWVDFLNTFAPRPMPAHVRERLVAPFNEIYLGPQWFGGGRSEFNPQTQTSRFILRPGVENAENIPVWGMSWRMAAVYCNWLHHGQSDDWNTLLDGAYDTSTWGAVDGSYTDDITHQAGARFWIPTLDEWAKAAFYDPNRFGPGQGGWWDRPHGTNDLPMWGFPGEPGAQTSVGIPILPGPGDLPMDIPLAAYNAMSPWGLFDTAGGTSEIVAERPIDDPAQHFWVETAGGSAGSNWDDPQFSLLHVTNATNPFYGDLTTFNSGFFTAGLRVAAAVPSPGSCMVAACAGVCWARRRRRT